MPTIGNDDRVSPAELEEVGDTLTFGVGAFLRFVGILTPLRQSRFPRCELPVLSNERILPQLLYPLPVECKPKNGEKWRELKHKWD